MLLLLANVSGIDPFSYILLSFTTPEIWQKEKKKKIQ